MSLGNTLNPKMFLMSGWGCVNRWIRNNMKPFVSPAQVINNSTLFTCSSSLIKDLIGSSSVFKIWIFDYIVWLSRIPLMLLFEIFGNQHFSTWEKTRKEELFQQEPLSSVSASAEWWRLKRDRERGRARLKGDHSLSARERKRERKGERREGGRAHGR